MLLNVWRELLKNNWKTEVLCCFVFCSSATTPRNISFADITSSHLTCRHSKHEITFTYWFFCSLMSTGMYVLLMHDVAFVTNTESKWIDWPHVSAHLDQPHYTIHDQPLEAISGTVSDITSYLLLCVVITVAGVVLIHLQVGDRSF